MSRVHWIAPVGVWLWASVAYCQEPFRLGMPVPSSLLRKDPHPKWVPVKWDSGEDAPFLPIRREIEAATSDVLARDTTGQWVGKARKAFDVWMRDCQSPVNLYRVSAYLAVADLLDPSFRSEPDYAKMTSYANKGWSVLRTPPASYEFARRGYLTNAGDLHYHVYGDLPFRLLKRDPFDRGVVIAMAREYVWRKPIASFEQVLFAGFERLSTSSAWRPWDGANWAMAYRSYGQKHRKLSAYKVAIKKAQSALERTPAGWDGSWLKRWIDDTRVESEDPDFGLPPGGKWIDDLDPP